MINKDLVALSKCDNYSQENLTAALTKIFDIFGGIENIVQKRKKVVIKPNLVLPKSGDSEKIALTNSKLLEALINLLCSVCDPKDITIAESPGGPYVKSFLERAYKLSNVREIAEKTGVNLNYDTTAKTLSKTINGIVKAYPVITPVAEADIVINLNRLKTHSLCSMTAAVKNMFGCIPGVEKFEFHSRFPERDAFSEMLVDLCQITAPTFSITDAIAIMEGNGPTGGTKRDVGLILGSFNPYTLDVVNCRILGYKESEVFTVVHSIKRELAKTFLKTEISGENPDNYAVANLIKPDTEKSLLSNIGKFTRFTERILYTQPQISKKCVKCGACVGNCPKKIIKKQNGKYIISDRKTCIKCYCCQELCPYDAIKTKKSLLLKILH